ncbi:MAG: two-component regulator propeller domain-containing protein [Bacteroidales bacterium]|nr:two-component regulator propeller domain-containing protein [Bacteroidales bacterium]
MIILFQVSSVKAQNTPLTFERVTTEQGLTSNSINGIVQDQSGFLWIATDNGLNRFDGVENKQYTHLLDDNSSLSNNTILTQYCDSKDQLWVLTINYLHRYNKKSDRFDSFLLSKKKESYRYTNKGFITSDKSGNIWIGTPTNGLFVYKKAINQCTKILPEIKSVSSLYFDPQGNLWIGGENGLLVKYNQSLKTSIKYRIPSELRRSVKDDFIWQIWHNKAGKLNLLLSCGFFMFDPATKTFKELSDWNQKVNYTNNELRSVYHDNQSIWVGTQGGGLYILDMMKNKIAHYQTISNNPSSLSNNIIKSIIKDRYGVFWICTSDGLNKYDPTMKLFAHYQNDPGNSNSLRYNFVSCFCESPEGNVWVGTFGQGISIFNPKNDTFNSIVNITGKSESYISNSVRALEPDKDGNIWIGTVNSLSRFNLKKKQVTHYRQSSEKGGLGSDDVMSLLVSSDNRLWIGTNGSGLSMCELGNKTIEFKNYKNKTGSGREKVRKIIELKNGTICLGTLGDGIIFLHNNQVKNITFSTQSKKIDSDYINDICEDNDSNVWVGTWDGLFLLDSNLTIRKQLNTNNGLPSGEIKGILSDQKGDIWVSSMNGLSHLIKKGNSNYKITNYTIHNGLQGSYFTAYSTLKTKNGELYFGGYNGFNVFSPEKILLNKEAPKVIFTDFQVFNQSVPINKAINGRIILKENITGIKTMTLNYKHRVIGFRFAALTTSQVENVKYACLMEGVDPDWVYLDNRRSISYNNLPSGEYSFTVKACNADGIWSDSGTSIKIKVLPPPWKTWWAYLLYLAMIAFLLYRAREYSLSRAKLQNQALVEHIQREKDAEINNLKLKFFTNISHEIRTPLTLIITPLEKLVNSADVSPEVKKYLQMMYRNAQRLLNLINQLLDFRKIETGNVHLHIAPYDIVSFIHEIKYAFDEKSIQKNITFTVKSNVQSLDLWFDPDSFEKILFNLLSNAFKFTPINGSIKITVNHLASEEKCEILVLDNGIGIPSDKLEKLFDNFYQVETNSFPNQENIGSGIGLSIVKNLVELHHGEINVESVPGEYSQFRMVFKTGKEHLEGNKDITISNESMPFSFNFHASILDMEEFGSNESLESPLGPHNKKSARILIVEDNPDIRYYLRKSLETEYEVFEAENGKSGCDLAIELIPDLIITDVMMPEMDGNELCRVLKNEMLTKHIPIIILSVNDSVSDTLEGLETGADDYMSKPFNEKVLHAKIKTLLSNRQKITEKYRLQPLIQNMNEESEAISYDDPLVNRIVQYIKANLSDADLTNEKIEQQFNTNKMQLYRKLKAVTGYSVNSLIREIRIQEAIQLLKNSEMNISEIAYNLGFSDPLYFSKYFKKEVGVSPHNYRKDH